LQRADSVAEAMAASAAASASTASTASSSSASAAPTSAPTASASSSASSASSSAADGGGGAEVPVLLRSRSYSSLSEDERKQLVAEALAAQRALQTELQALKSQLQQVSSSGVGLVRGEAEALKGDEVKYFTFYPERTHDATPEQMYVYVCIYRSTLFKPRVVDVALVSAANQRRFVVLCVWVQALSIGRIAVLSVAGLKQQCMGFAVFVCVCTE
jgi:hypothetical protein